MDLFKKMNVVKATSYDYNAPKNIVSLRDRSKISRMLSRYSRRKLKQELKCNV